MLYDGVHGKGAWDADKAKADTDSAVKTLRARRHRVLARYRHYSREARYEGPCGPLVEAENEFAAA